MYICTEEWMYKFLNDQNYQLKPINHFYFYVHLRAKPSTLTFFYTIIAKLCNFPGNPIQ